MSTSPQWARSPQPTNPTRSTPYHSSSSSAAMLDLILPPSSVHRPLSDSNLVDHSSFRGMRRLEARRQMEETNYLASKARAQNLNPPVDLRLLDYVVPYDENLMCPICRCPFLDPVVLCECDHYFCRDCIRQTWSSNHTPHGPRGDCPSCRTPAKLGPRSATSKILVNITDDLLVRCPKSEQGCAAQVKRGEVQDHVSIYCGYAPTPCPAAGCEQPVRRKDVAQGCLHYGVSCLECREAMPKSNLEAHWQSECHDRLVSCKLCDEGVYYRELERHQSETCAAVPSACPGQAFGCTTRSARAQAELHAQSCTFAALAPLLTGMQARLAEQEAAQKLLVRKLDTMENGMQALQDILASSTHPDLDRIEADESRIPFLTEHARNNSESTLDAFFASPTDPNIFDFPAPPSSQPTSTLSLAQAPVSLPPSRPAPPPPTHLPDPAFDTHPPTHHHHHHPFPPTSSSDPYASPLHHLLSLHESLRAELSRLAAAVQEQDARQSTHALNETLRTREELAYLGAQVGGVSRQVHWLTSAQLMRQQQQQQQQDGSPGRGSQGRVSSAAQGRDVVEISGAGAGVEAAVSSAAATVVRGVGRVVDVGMGVRRGVSEEGRTKL
ncbi:hypothetical protein LTR08_003593 [Meristemomyces frigidus]|nr:hypothetical protein LTR08_003593 [Meristemomyces frigidus]